MEFMVNSKEVNMTKIADTTSAAEELIDMGDAGVQTKGSANFHVDGSLTQPKDILPGISLED